MCDVLDRIEKRGLEKGREEGRIEGRIEGLEEGRVKGREEGREEGQVEMALNLHKQGVGLDIIAMAAGVGVEVVERWLGLVLA